MSEERGLVSLWVGTAPSDEALEDYLTFTFTPDGDSIPCPFGRDFGIDWFDEDFREQSVRDAPTRSLGDLLAGHMDADQITPAYAGLYGEILPFDCNATVLLYGIEYAGSIPSAGDCDIWLRFLGTVRY